MTVCAEVSHQNQPTNGLDVLGFGGLGLFRGPGRPANSGNGPVARWEMSVGVWFLEVARDTRFPGSSLFRMEKPMGSHVGGSAPPILVYFSKDWDVHWGYGLLTHGQVIRPMACLVLGEAERFITRFPTKKRNANPARNPISSCWFQFEALSPNPPSPSQYRAFCQGPSLNVPFGTSWAKGKHGETKKEVALTVLGGSGGVGRTVLKTGTNIWRSDSLQG